MAFPRIFALTGAGVSAESGLGTFRDTDGIWARFDPMDLASIEGYRRDPARVLDFYNKRRAGLRAARPNAAHAALARLEAEAARRGGDLFLCTQNIDDLHEQAGAAAVWHMHGELKKSRCGDCGDVAVIEGDILAQMGCPACGRIGGLRPHVVWFGEEPLYMDAILEALARADLFVAIGTSGAVYPAAGFVETARARGARTVALNLAPSDNAARFHDALYGKASEITPAWVEAVLGGDDAMSAP